MKSPRLFTACAVLLFGALRLEGEDAKFDHPPEILEKAKGEYPKVMATYQTEGLVVTEVIIDATGRPTQPRVVVCTHFEFEHPGVEAVINSKFKPATKNGEPVEGVFRFSQSFSVVGVEFYEYFRAKPAFKVPDKSPPGYLPEFQYDVAPFPKLVCKAVYPRELLAKNIKGFATMAFLVDPSGRPRRIEVQKSSRPEFGAAAGAMIAAWRFSPPMKNGKPTWTELSFKQVFDNADRDSPVNPAIKRLLKELASPKPAIVTDVSQLDASPQVRYRAEPTVSDEIQKSGRPATATIEFILDRDGHVQMPRVVTADNESFGWAAATAVNRWIFTLPTRQGESVDVVMRVPLDYVPPVSDGSGKYVYLSAGANVVFWAMRRISAASARNWEGDL